MIDLFLIVFDLLFDLLWMYYYLGYLLIYYFFSLGNYFSLFCSFLPNIFTFYVLHLKWCMYVRTCSIVCVYSARVWKPLWDNRSLFVHIVVGASLVRSGDYFVPKIWDLAIAHYLADSIHPKFRMAAPWLLVSPLVTSQYRRQQASVRAMSLRVSQQ